MKTKFTNYVYFYFRKKGGKKCVSYVYLEIYVELNSSFNI